METQRQQLLLYHQTLKCPTFQQITRDKKKWYGIGNSRGKKIRPAVPQKCLMADLLDKDFKKLSNIQKAEERHVKS